MISTAAIAEHSLELKKIVDFEESKLAHFKDMGFRMAWDYGDVGINPTTLYRLFTKGILVLPFGAGGKTKNYALTDRERTKKRIKELEAITSEQPTPKETGVPGDLFDLIVGYDDIKEMFKLSLAADKPVHLFLVGPPASAKSLFLMEIERLEGAVFCLGGAVTRVGIRELLFDLPQYLIIDEFDKVSDPKDVSSLLSWMESGRVTVDKHGSHLSVQGKGWVFAAANRLGRLPPEILSRFMVFQLKEYNQEEYQQIVVNILVKRENVPEELAQHIANKMTERSRDVRDAVKIARLAKDKESVDTVVKIVDKYR